MAPVFDGEHRSVVISPSAREDTTNTTLRLQASRSSSGCRSLCPLLSMISPSSSKRSCHVDSPRLWLTSEEALGMLVTDIELMSDVD